MDTNNMSVIEKKETAAKPSKSISYSSKDCVLAAVVAVIAIVFMRVIIWKHLGFLATGLFAGLTTASVIYLRSSGLHFSPLNKAITAVLYAFSVVFSITDNGTVFALDTLFLIIGTAYLFFSVTNEKKDIERFLIIALFKSLMEVPLSRLGAQLSITADAAGKSKTGSRFRSVIIGLIVTVPLTAIIGTLLMSADAGMESMLTNVLETVFCDDIETFIYQLCIAFPFSLYLFAIMYNHVYNKDVSRIDQEGAERFIDSTRCIPNMVMYTAVTPVLALYVMFFFSQASYFLSAFNHSLPQGYSYAEYARRGFFELFWITLINLAILIFMNYLAKQGGRHKPLCLKIYNVILSVFTLVLIATAVSKMIMYISAFGLTELRLYTTWFMVLCAVLFVFIIIKQFSFEFRFARWTVFTFTFMFALLCFTRTDALIARFNISMYNSGYHEELDTAVFYNMSDDAVLTAVDMGALSAEDVREHYDGWRFDDDSAQYNFSSLMLADRLK